MRQAWESLDGFWEFAFDDHDLGLRERWYVDPALPGRIKVPFAPESVMSGIGETGFHAVVWYARVISLNKRSDGSRVLLHFGAVDHSCRVWVDGNEVGVHVGGQTPFTFDISDALAEDSSHTLVVRAHDDPHDLEVPRGKQDWLQDPHVIWYTRTTGIWQSVWLESVPETHIVDLAWSTDIVSGSVTCEVALSTRTHGQLSLEMLVELHGKFVASARVDVVGGVARVVAYPPLLRAGQAREALHWSPENPILFDAVIRLEQPEGIVEEVASYFGARSVEASSGTFKLNGVPYFVRAVLEQGYWPDSLMTAPDDEARRREVKIIKALGFNTARIHQKVEDPRFLFWADRLGLMIWGETGAAYDFTPRAVTLLSAEWSSIVNRDRSHPSIVVWVPMNESWGVQDIARNESQRQFVRSLASLTRALDDSRPVISNDGWEHVDSDIFTIHDYASDAQLLHSRYATSAAVRSSVDAVGPAGRELSLDVALSEAVRTGKVPVMVSEFGGISFSGDGSTWGYAQVDSEDGFKGALAAVFAELGEGSAIAGFCYTQLTDTQQEANGLLSADRTPKLPVPLLREIITGIGERESRFVWPPVTEATT